MACAHALERLIEREGAETVAAFVAEPIGGSTAGRHLRARGGGRPDLRAGDDIMFYTYSAHSGACAAAEKVVEASITSAVARAEA